MFLLQNSFLIWATIVLAKVKWRCLVVGMWTASLRRREWSATKSKAACCRGGCVNQYSEVLDRALRVHQLSIWWSIQTLDFLFFSVTQQSKSGLGRHAGEVSKPRTITARTHTHTPTHTTHTHTHTQHTRIHTHTPHPHTHTPHKRTHARARTHAHTHTHTHTHGIHPLKESPDRRRSRYLYNTQQTKDMNIHAFIGARTRETCNQEAADLCLRPHGHRAWQYSIYLHISTAHKVSHNTHYLPVFSKRWPNLGLLINYWRRRIPNKRQCLISSLSEGFQTIFRDKMNSAVIREGHIPFFWGASKYPLRK